MSVALRTRDQSRLNLIDYGLMGIGSSLAAYTAGMAIGSDMVAQFLGGAVLMGTGVSFAIRTLLDRTSFVKVDGILYAAAILCAIVGFGTLNGFLPDDGFERDVAMAGVLAWMLVLGSGLTWRDGTLLFQAIPSVALFGLVGCYDTYVYAPYLFFGFLVCLAIVLARANRREMMRQAVQSGYFNRADAPSAPQDFPEQSTELYEDIRRGPWRWLAGPEWALASALVIILLSRLGAPVLQEAAKPITGAARFATPQSIRRLAANAPREPETSYVVGRGPNGSLSERVLFVAQLDRPRYMRTAAFEVYTGRGWRTDRLTGLESGGPVAQSVIVARQAIGGAGVRHSFSVRPQEPTRQLPLPAEPMVLSRGAQILPDGGGRWYTDRAITIEGELIESGRQPQTAPRDFGGLGRQLFDASRVTPRVREFAERQASGATDDFDAASRIARGIAGQVRYNINAAAVPAESDPADWFLFTNQEGYCDLFATAMTLCARSVGLPARYVIGYLPEKSNGDGSYVLREADYHAWCEVFFEDTGWVVFDATAGAPQVEGGERGSADEERPWYQRDWFQPAARGLLVVAVLVAGYVLFRYVRPRPKPVRHEAHRAYVVFERTLRRALGRRRQPGETLEEYARAAETIVGASVVSLGRRFSRALFGAEMPTDEELAGLRAETKALKPIKR